MIATNIKFTSNIEPVHGKIESDTAFLQKIHDIKCLKEMSMSRLRFSSDQQKEYNSCALPCEKTKEKNDYVYGLSSFDGNKNEILCKCTNIDCESFSFCRRNNEFTDDELLPEIENDDYKEMLIYADAYINKINTIKTSNKNNVDDDELHVEISYGNIVITPGPKKTTTKKKVIIYKPTGTFIAPGAEGATPPIIQPEISVSHKPLLDIWFAKSLTRQPNMNICTARTRQIIWTRAEEELSKKLDEKTLKEEIERARENGKHTSTGYDFIKQDYLKDKALSGKFNREFKEMLNRLRVQSTPLEAESISYGSKVTISDRTDPDNEKQYSLIILGDEDARFLEDYRIIPYTSELGSAFYGHHLGDYVQVSFSGEEAPHACKIISIETSDYLQLI